MSEYRKLNFDKIAFSDDTVSYDEVLENSTPLKFTDNIVLGQKKINITKAERDYENRCVKLEIFC